MDQNKTNSKVGLGLLAGGILLLLIIAFIGWRAIGRSSANTTCTGSEVELCLSISSLDVGLDEEIMISGELMNIGGQDLEFQAAQVCSEGGIMIVGGETLNFSSPICDFGFEGTIPLATGSMLATRNTFIASEFLSAGENEINLMFDGATVSMTVTAS